MLLHVDSTKYKIKPGKSDIGRMKVTFTKAATVKDLTVQQIAAKLTAGQTIQPGVTPYSEATKAQGKTGTADADFARQTIFLNDIDNKIPDTPIETPAHVAEFLAAHNLKAAFMYETFNSTAEHQRFRFALVSDEEFTDKAERDNLQEAIIAAFPQSDPICTNADRMFFGTDKGLIDEYTDFEAVCRKADLLAFAEKYKPTEEEKRKAQEERKSAQQATAGTQKAGQTTQQGSQQQDTRQKSKPKFSDPIPVGQRHSTLLSFANATLTLNGISEQAEKSFLQRAEKCTEPLPTDELQKIWKDCCRHYETEIATRPDYIPPAQYKAMEFAENLEPNDQTDVGQAIVFARLFGDKVKYTTATKYLVYDGKKWNESEIKAQGLSQELTERQLKQARKRLKAAHNEYIKVKESDDKDLTNEAAKELAYAKDYHEYVLSRRTTDKVKATLTEARPMLEIDVTELDKDGFLLNTPGGTVDLHTGKMRPHDPKDYCTKITEVAPNTKNAELFAGFMERVTVGDKSLERYLQEVAGMCAVGKVERENLIMAYGQGGNGKSTLFNLLAHVLGDYSGMLSAETLTANCRKNKSPEYAELRGKRLIIAAELEEGMRLDTAVVKKLCSTDPIQAEKKYKDPFDFIPSHTVILYTNHLPKIGTNDKGTWDRIVAVPFNANFRGMKGEIKNYADYLFQHCGGAVLTWIIEGAKRFIANDFNIEMPDCVKSSIEQYKANNDWLDNFLAECCEVAKTNTERSGELYQRYKTYCDNTGDYRRSLADFKQALTTAGYETRKTKTGAVVYGLKLAPDTSGFTPVDEPTPWDAPF